MVNFSATLTKPASLSLVSYLIQATVLASHKDTAQVCGGDGQDIGVVRGD